MFIDIPVFDYQKIAAYQTLDIFLPYCVGSVTDLRWKYKVFTETECISFTKVWHEQHYILTRVPHSVCTDETEKTKVLGNRFYHFGFMRDDVTQVQFEEIKPFIDEFFYDSNNIFLTLLLQKSLKTP